MSEYTESVKHFTQGLAAISTRPCPGCEQCQKLYGFATLESLEEAWETGKIGGEPHFSWSACDICGSHFGGDREEWHAINKETGELIHGDNACVDCVVYLANGDEPEEWNQYPDPTRSASL